jgi:hypothetical protein
MRISFTRAGYALAAGVAVTALLGMSAASATAGSAPRNLKMATSACGKLCTDIFNEGLGTKQIPTTAGRYGDPVRLTHAHNFLKSQDFIANPVGTVYYFCHTGLIPINSYACIHYQVVPGFPLGYPVYEAQYSPGSFTSGLCAGVGIRDVREGGLITLRACGDNARTLWVADLYNYVKDARSQLKLGLLRIDVPLVNAASGSISIPLVLTTNDHGTLTLQDLAQNGGRVYDSQEWGLGKSPV